MENTEQKNLLETSLSSSFSQGWKVMEKHFLVLFLVIIVVMIVSAPAGLMRFNLNMDDLRHIGLPWHYNGDWDFPWPGPSMIAFGTLAVLFGLFALAYSLLIIPIFKFGGDMMFVQAARDTRPDFNTLVSGFKENYLSIILANLLLAALVTLGFIACIIPGIIIACRLVFVSYLVMDKKLDPIAAIEQSWKLTQGHGWTILGMAIVSFFIGLAGLILCFVGIFPASIWISSSFASLYDAVLQEKSNPELSENAPA